MPDKPTKPSGRPPGAKPPAPRRTSVRKERSTLGVMFREAARSPNFAWAVMIGAAFALLASMLAVWAREQPLVAVGRVMTETRTVRYDFTVERHEKTEEERQEARQSTPRVLVAQPGLEEVRADLEHLPRAVGAAEELADVDVGLAERFGLTEESFAALKSRLEPDEAQERWSQRTGALMALLRRRPLLSSDDWIDATSGTHQRFELRVGDEQFMVDRQERPAIDIATGGLAEEMASLARRAGFTDPVSLSLIAARLSAEPRPTFRYDSTATGTSQQVAVDAVEPVMQEIVAGTPIFTRGEPLRPSQLDLYRAELREFRARAPAWRLWLRWVGVLGAVGSVTAALGIYMGLFCPRVRRRPARMAWIALLLLGTLAIACVAAVVNPAAVMLAATAPVLFVAAIMVVAYDQRVALAVTFMHGILVCIALGLPISVLAVILVGGGAAVLLLREIKDRRTLIRMSVATAATLTVATLLIGLIDRPIVPAALLDTLSDAVAAGAGGLLVGAVVWFILPQVEHIFDITTGMTLVELRDPKHPLLRQLQQHAPGTYNHSLNVATIAEAAADSIGADPLLTYVGALYHDIGKMNKPEYFVENQSGGPNKHDKLSPAMSLLVIVGHVKDGLELAREFELPRTLHHFIEAHHGTTLVEYFYERARRQAMGQGEDQSKPAPEEIEYRYPGPRPRTKECAILMLADAVESATRSMAEPTPGRIDALVRDLANKRLLDGQFDECDLTLRELRSVAESISKTVSSIYHGRIAYPRAGERRA